MAFVTFTRPDDSSVSINADQVLKLVPVPTSGPTMGPLAEGTRIHFLNRTHQDVKQLLHEAEALLNAAT